MINLNEIALKSFSEFVKLEDFTEKYESYNEDKNTNQKTIQNNIGKFFIDGTSPYFAYVYILKMVNPNKIDYSEKWQSETDALKTPSVKKYADWYRQGFLPFPIQTSKNKKGVDISANRRRLLAARVAKKKIPAFVEIGRYKDIVLAAKNNGAFDRYVKSGSITKNKVTRILNSINK